jgi:hypothetical protein
MITSACIGTLLGTYADVGLPSVATAPFAFAGIVVGPMVGTALLVALPATDPAERWRLADLFLPASASATAFSFVVAQIISTGLGADVAAGRSWCAGGTMQTGRALRGIAVAVSCEGDRARSSGRAPLRRRP